MNNENYVELNSFNQIAQEFDVSNKQIEAIQVFAHEDESFDDFTIKYSLYDKETLIGNGSLKVGNVTKDNPIMLGFKDKLTNLKGKKLKLVLSTDSTSTLNLNTDKHNLSLSIVTNEFTSFSKLALITSGFLVVLFCVMAFILKFCHLDFNKYCLVSVFILGMILNLFIPVGNVPDEANAHMKNAYHISNKILRVQDDVNNIKMRKCDLDIFHYVYANDAVMDSYVQNILSKNSDETELVDSEQQVVQVGIYMYTYFLSGLGIAIGRLLNLNGILCVLIGRFLNFSLFLSALGYCLKKTPKFKEIFVLLALFPITLQQVFSVSYDSIVLSLAFVIASLTIQLFYNRKLGKKETILLVITCLLLIPCKSFAYSPLVLAPLSFFIKDIDFERFKNKKGYILIGVILALLCAVYLLAAIILGRMVSNASVLYLAFHPKFFYSVLRQTLYNKLNFYIFSAVGSSMELCHVGIFAPIILGYIIVMCLLISKINPKVLGIKKVNQYVFIFIILICFLGTLGGMYSWSCSVGMFGGRIVEGFQGRYILPVIPLLFLCFNKDTYETGSISKFKLLNTCNYLGILAIFSLMIELLTH
uniref:DUF2142 domain-containing protein n=1 Tax=Holdemanella biformis TaxID=1735 RepID=UPI004025FF53